MTKRNITKVDEGIINKNIKHIKHELLERPHIRLHKLLNEHDDPYSGETLTPLAKTTEDSLYLFFGTYKAVKEVIDQNKIFEDRFTIKENFSDIYGLYISAVSSRNILEEIVNESITLKTKHDFNFERGNHTILSDLIETYCGGIRNLNGSGENLTAITLDYYDWIIEETKGAAKDEKYQNVLKQAENWDIEVNKLVFHGFNAVKNKKEQESSLAVFYDNIVGNEKAIQKCKELASYIACYDPISQTNQIINSTKALALALIGRPGTGKSLLINALKSDLEAYADYKGIPFNYAQIDNPTIKNKYHGEGVKALKDAFLKVKDPKGIGLIAFDDTDQVIENRNNYDASMAEGQLLHEVLQQMDGLNKNYKGNFIVVFASNRPDKIDIALQDRIGKKNFYEISGPQSIQDYTKLFEVKIGSSIKYINFNGKNTKDIGEILYSYNLDGREVDTFTTDIISRVCGGVIPKEITALQGGEQLKAIENLRKRIDCKDIIKELHDLYKK